MWLRTSVANRTLQLRASTTLLTSDSLSTSSLEMKKSKGAEDIKDLDLVWLETIPTSYPKRKEAKFHHHRHRRSPGQEQCDHSSNPEIHTDNLGLIHQSYRAMKPSKVNTDQSNTMITKRQLWGARQLLVLCAMARRRKSSKRFLTIRLQETQHALARRLLVSEASHRSTSRAEKSQVCSWRFRTKVAISHT